MPVRFFSWRFGSFEILWILFFSFRPNQCNMIVTECTWFFDLQFPFSLKIYHLSLFSLEILFLCTYLGRSTHHYLPYHQSGCCWSIWTEGGQMQCPLSHIKHTAGEVSSSLLPPAFVICSAQEQYQCHALFLIIHTPKLSVSSLHIKTLCEGFFLC